MVSTLWVIFFQSKYFKQGIYQKHNEYQIDRFEKIKSTFLYLFRHRKSFRSSHHTMLCQLMSHLG